MKATILNSMYSDRKTGMTYTAIANKYKVTRQHVNFQLLKYFPKIIRKPETLTKQCPECLVNFSGLLSLMKHKHFCSMTCRIAFYRKTRAKGNSPDELRAWQRNRMRLYYRTPKGKIIINRLNKISNKKYPEKARARNILNYHLRHGNIIKPSVCSICKLNPTRIEAHHTDYSKPLEVVWLCSFHHRVADRELALK